MKLLLLKILAQIELWFLSLVDKIMDLFNIFAGLKEIDVGDGNSIDLLTYFLTNKTVLNIFIVLIVLSAGVATILTLVAVLKNMIQMKRKMSKIAAQYLTSVMSMVIVGAVLILGVFLSSNILILVNKSFTGVAGAENIGTQVLDISASNAYIDTSKAKEQPDKFYWIVAVDDCTINDAKYEKGQIISYLKNYSTSIVKWKQNTTGKTVKEVLGFESNEANVSTVALVVLNGENFKKLSNVQYLTPDIFLGDYDTNMLDLEKEPEEGVFEYWFFGSTQSNIRADVYPEDLYTPFVYKNNAGIYVWALGSQKYGGDSIQAITGEFYTEYIDAGIEASVKVKDQIIKTSGSNWEIGTKKTDLLVTDYPAETYDVFVTTGKGNVYYWYIGIENDSNGTVLTSIDGKKYGSVIDVNVSGIQLEAEIEPLDSTDVYVAPVAQTLESGTNHFGLVNYNSYQFVIGLFAAVMLIIVLCIAIMGLIARLFDLVFLLLSSPLITATIPLDEGAKFKLWRETVISKTLLAYGTVIGINVYCLILPLINNINIDNNQLATMIVKIFLVIVGALTISNSSLLFARIMGTDASESRQTMHSVAQLVGGVATTGKLIKGASGLVFGTKRQFLDGSTTRTNGLLQGTGKLIGGIGTVLGGQAYRNAAAKTSNLIKGTGTQTATSFMQNNGLIGSASKGIKKVTESAICGVMKHTDLFENIGSN